MEKRVLTEGNPVAKNAWKFNRRAVIKDKKKEARRLECRRASDRCEWCVIQLIRTI